MVVAIDGPAGAGKSTIASFIAQTLGFFNLNSGSFYRAIAVKVLDDGVDTSDENAVIQAARSADLEIQGGALFLDGANVENRLRNDTVDHWSSVLSTIVPVRHAINAHLRRIAGTIDLVAEGRDMTTVVFPEAEIKIYLDADSSVRARRRFHQGTSKNTMEEIQAAILERDERDRSKEEGALLIATDAVVVDTSSLTLEQVYDKVTQLIKTHLHT